MGYPFENDGKTKLQYFSLTAASTLAMIIASLDFHTEVQ